MSDIKHMNDYMEKEWAFKIVTELLEEVLISEGVTIDLDEAFYYAEGINSHREYFESEIKSMLDVYKLILIACFSKDGDKLSQWRAYADDGNGLSIGFNKKILDKLVNEGAYRSSFSVKEIVYSEKEQQKILSDIIVSGVKRAKNYYHDIGILNDWLEFFQLESEIFGEYIAREILDICCYLKNPSFQEENEVRVIYNPFLTEEDVEDTKLFDMKSEWRNFSISALNSMNRNGINVSYCDLGFENYLFDNLINEIIIGPKSKLSENDLRLKLKIQGFNIENIIVKALF
ncbi:DUF2971 domain-containing protein [Turicibacter sanguinis]|nr:DUF2971 domain-containing protein [Turicibacter sanguinis]